MDYDSRQIKWYWLLLFVLYCGAVIYLLFQGNPFLYSNQELRASLMTGPAAQKDTFPSKPETEGVKAGAATHFLRFNFERSGVDKVSPPRSKNLVEHEQHPAEIGVDGFEIQNVASDSSGFYLTGKSPW